MLRRGQPSSKYAPNMSLNETGSHASALHLTRHCTHYVIMDVSEARGWVLHVQRKEGVVKVSCLPAVPAGDEWGGPWWVGIFRRCADRHVSWFLVHGPMYRVTLGSVTSINEVGISISFAVRRKCFL